MRQSRGQPGTCPTPYDAAIPDLKVQVRPRRSAGVAGQGDDFVAPDIGERAEGLRSKAGMTIVRREHLPEDLDRRPFLVVTATDDAALNRRILDACRARGVLCACPDGGWENGLQRY